MLFFRERKKKEGNSLFFNFIFIHEKNGKEGRKERKEEGKEGRKD